MCLFTTLLLELRDLHLYEVIATFNFDYTGCYGNANSNYKCDVISDNLIKRIFVQSAHARKQKYGVNSASPRKMLICN